MRPQTGRIQPVHDTALGNDGQDARRTELGRLADGEVRRAALGRREGKPDIRRRRLRVQAMQRHRPARAAFQSRDFRLPFAVPAVEQREPVADASAHDPAEPGRLPAVERNGRSFTERGIDEQAQHPVPVLSRAGPASVHDPGTQIPASFLSALDGTCCSS